MPPALVSSSWDLSPAIDLLKTLTISKEREPVWLSTVDGVEDNSKQPEQQEGSLGNFDKIFEFLDRHKHIIEPEANITSNNISTINCEPYPETEKVTRDKAVRWRDQDAGTNLEDKSDPAPYNTAATLRQQRRAERKAKKKAKAAASRQEGAGPSRQQAADSTTDFEDSDEELERIRHSPDRRAVIQSILNPTSSTARAASPPSSPSPPKASTVSILKREWPVADPFHYHLNEKISARRSQIRIAPIDGLDAKQRKLNLVSILSDGFPEEEKLLANAAISDPRFTAVNTTKAGIHVFIDISNIMIGFHDCLKLARDLPVTDRVRRVPMSFHNFSLILERGRPAAKRVLVGSDKYPVIEEARTLGYETNILERVHKAKELTPRQKRFKNGNGTSGASSGSETDRRPAPAKWVEQGVDELLHMKMLESLVDAAKPSTIVLATGDAAEAEFSAGFMRMVERALGKGWMVELVSFKLNTSGLYKRKDFRSKWGEMFKWIQLDAFVESLLGYEDDTILP